MSDFEIMNSSFDSDMSDYLDMFKGRNISKIMKITSSRNKPIGQFNHTCLSQGRMIVTTCRQWLITTNKVKMLTIVLIFRCGKLTTIG